MARTATCVWRLTPELLLALDAQLGPPVDSYVNGTQSWLTDDGPGGAALEWRLHPAAGYRLPHKLSHYDLWELVVDAVVRDPTRESVTLGSETRAFGEIWDGLECFAPHDPEIEPAPLATAATQALGLPPDATGMVDHDRVGSAWEHAHGSVSIVEMLLDEIGG